MSKILVLAQSGFGKSTSIGKIPELGIEGLNPEETFVISATTKPLPFPKSSQLYKICDIKLPPTKENGNRLATNNGPMVAKTIDYLITNRLDIKNIVFDDSNYVMQDYYMANAKKKGYDVFKEVGLFMNQIFSAMERAINVNFIMMAHFEEYTNSTDGQISYRYKTVGKMVQDYITPEGKFDVVLYGKQTFDHQNNQVSKQFVTNYDGQFPAKSAFGMFNEMLIPNDLGYVVKKVNEYYG